MTSSCTYILLPIFIIIHPKRILHKLSRYAVSISFPFLPRFVCILTSESVVGRHLGWHYKVYSFAIIQLKKQTQLIHLFLFYFIIALLLWRIIDSFKLPVLISATAAENYLCTVFWKISQDDSDYNLYNSTYFLIEVRLTIFLYNRLYYMHG